MEWHPIETAPRNGKAIIVFQPGVRYRGGAEYGSYVTEATYQDDCGAKDEQGRFRLRFYSESWNTVLCPTHWMPLPEPPDYPIIDSPSVGPTRPLGGSLFTNCSSG